jgi:hypothetical protein
MHIYVSVPCSWTDNNWHSSMRPCVISTEKLSQPIAYVLHWHFQLPHIASSWKQVVFPTRGRLDEHWFIEHGLRTNKQLGPFAVPAKRGIATQPLQSRVMGFPFCRWKLWHHLEKNEKVTCQPHRHFFHIHSIHFAYPLYKVYYEIKRCGSLL